jgi:nucleoside-diphosphate-sugar epimerase
MTSSDKDDEIARRADELEEKIEAAKRDLKADSLEGKIEALKRESMAEALESLGALPKFGLLPLEAAAIPDAGQRRLPLSGGPDPRAKIPGARELPACTVVVAGANGRVGSRVVTELLRKHPKVKVRGLVRSAQDISSYERLSYEVGAEDGKGTLRPALQLGEGGFLPAAELEFDENVMGSYGLDRLDIRECELRHRPDVREALAGADCVIYCATTFGEGRTRLPEQLDDFNRGVAQFGTNLFELRLPGFGPPEKSDAAARRESAKGRTADVEGLQNVLLALAVERKRRADLRKLSGLGAADYEELTPVVVASASAALGYQEDSDGSPREMEFGYRKRMGEEAVRVSGLDHVILRSAELDQLRLEEGLAVQNCDGVVAEAMTGAGAGSAGVADKEKKYNRIHPRDLARVLVACLFPDAQREGGSTVEVWTESFGRKNPSLSPEFDWRKPETIIPDALFTTDPEAVRQRWRDEKEKED